MSGGSGPRVSLGDRLWGDCERGRVAPVARAVPMRRRPFARSVLAVAFRPSGRLNASPVSLRTAAVSWEQERAVPRRNVIWIATAPGEARAQLVVISCGGRSPKEHSQAAAQVTRPVASVHAARRLLEGNGIGSITFGRQRSAVIAELERLLGPPYETNPGICGFGRSTDWSGLNINSHDPNFSAQLTLDFKHSWFVGYAYLANADGPARERHGVLLATTRGLTLGDTVARARHLYGRAFVETSVPQGTPPSPKLPRLPVGEVSMASGQILAGIQGSGRQDRITAHSTVTWIGAGAAPNTPCP
jgi:hypothetical protein